ncbi:beta-lactamase-like protein [Mycena belliarum]|uniref:Beta-lactamase-like protein n=1 Tax=Mycena belliarum TaxID=1033014 RepID=A0AAD6XJ91_9AGAR|nr:beta-lactamase-like protein [Mycena belliae]
MSFHDLGIPESPSTVTVKIYNVVDEPNTVVVPASVFLSPVLPGNENLGFPVFAFLIENAATKQRVMFDLGPRKDLHNAVQSIAEAAKAGIVAFPVTRDIVEQLNDTDVDLDTISAVIWSHAHFDHIGDMSKFPSSIELVFGQDMVRPTESPDTQLNEGDLVGRQLVPIDFANSQLEISGFKAHDFYGDGSLYLLDVPGHLEGHICALARVTPTSFLLLAGDAVFHPGLIRPTAKLRQLFPYTSQLVSATRHSISATHFPPLDSAGKFDLAARTTPLLDISESGYFEDPPTVRASMKKIQIFDENPDVFVVFGHDESLMSVVGQLPTSLDGWKAKGWKERHAWAFLDEKSPAFRFNMKASV